MEHGEVIEVDGLAKLTREMEAAERRAALLRKQIEIVREVGVEGVADMLGLKVTTNGNGNGHAKPTNGTGAETAGTVPVAVEEKTPRGREAVRIIVRERPGVWTLQRLRAEMKRRGWFTSNKAVEVAVTRLMALGECRRVGKGRYDFFVQPEEAA
jgi:hypothetical protein